MKDKLILIASIVVFQITSIILKIQKDNLQDELKNLKREAISKQYAEWEVSEHGLTQFKWK